MALQLKEEISFSNALEALSLYLDDGEDDADTLTVTVEAANEFVREEEVPAVKEGDIVAKAADPTAAKEEDAAVVKATECPTVVDLVEPAEAQEQPVFRHSDCDLFRDGHYYFGDCDRYCYPGCDSDCGPDCDKQCYVNSEKYPCDAAYVNPFLQSEAEKSAHVQMVKDRQSAVRRPLLTQCALKDKVRQDRNQRMERNEKRKLMEQKALMDAKLRKRRMELRAVMLRKKLKERKEHLERVLHQRRLQLKKSDSTKVAVVSHSAGYRQTISTFHSLQQLQPLQPLAGLTLQRENFQQQQTILMEQQRGFQFEHLQKQEQQFHRLSQQLHHHFQQQLQEFKVQKMRDENQILKQLQNEQGQFFNYLQGQQNLFFKQMQQQFLQCIQSLGPRYAFPISEPSFPRTQNHDTWYDFEPRFVPAGTIQPPLSQPPLLKPITGQPGQQFGMRAPFNGKILDKDMRA